MTSPAMPTQPSPPLPETTHLRIALAWVIGLTTLRLFANALTGLELYGDEAQYWTWAQTLDLGYFTKPPLIAWIIAATTSVCGDAEACVRASSPLLHAGTALALYGLGRSVADSRVAMWSALIWITLPSIAFSSLIVSTDVPLLFCWALAATGYRRLLDTRAWRWAVVAGLAIGVGMLAKYAMAYAFLGIALHLVVSPRDRWILRDLRGLLVLALALLILSPNLYWNAANHFATVAHLGDNTNLGADPSQKFRISKALQFLGEQAGVFGPIPFAILAWRLIAWIRGRASDTEKFLLAIALPPLAVITFQAFLSRANANWAATAYPTATVLVALWLVGQAPRWMRYATLVPHVVACLAFAVVVAVWPTLRIPLTDRGFSRMAGWEKVAEAARPEILTNPDLPVLMTDRIAMASLLYYMRDQLGVGDLQPGKRPVYVWDWNRQPEHHYELAVPYDPEKTDRALMITEWETPAAILDHFEATEQVRVISITSYGRTRRLEVWLVSGFKGWE
ncbi:ArnT family glycosyltransferase [Thalassobaculum salexigens]|uniref:ArnT family glycosyltransferase n=1 Tax=Thalassobaculum salexigens TaxID=455360 RepID=UPI000686A5A6|nr:glycosyltransferase family 39 protein [Thalassobaculum salexigens]